MSQHTHKENTKINKMTTHSMENMNCRHAILKTSVALTHLSYRCVLAIASLQFLRTSYKMSIDFNIYTLISMTISIPLPMRYCLYLLDFKNFLRKGIQHFIWDNSTKKKTLINTVFVSEFSENPWYFHVSTYWYLCNQHTIRLQVCI